MIRGTKSVCRGALGDEKWNVGFPGIAAAVLTSTTRQVPGKQEQQQEGNWSFGR